MTDWDRIEAEIVEQNRKASDSVDPAAAAKRLDEQRQLAIREGWSDADGNTLLPQEDEEEDEA
jgi:hypothetical protein